MSVCIRKRVFTWAWIALVAVAALTAAVREPSAAMRVAATPAPGWYPLANGDTAAYAIAETDMVVYPNSTPSANSYGYTSTSEDSCPFTFGSYANLCDVQGLDTLDTGTFEDLYIGLFPAGNAQTVSEAGYLYVDSANGYTDTQLATFESLDTLDVIPEMAGNSWSGVAQGGYTDMVTGPQRYSSATVFEESNGLYRYTTKTVTPAKHQSSVLSVRQNTNASEDEVLKQTGYNTLHVTIGVAKTVAGQNVIPVTTSGGNALPATPAPVVTVNVPDWYPGGGAAPKKLFSDNTTDLGQATMPAACGVYAGGQAEHRQELYLQIEPLLGRVTNETADYYDVFGNGAVCSLYVVTDQYYDNLNSGALLVTGIENIAWNLSAQTFSQQRYGKSRAQSVSSGTGGPSFSAHLRKLRAGLDARFARRLDPSAQYPSALRPL